MKIENFGNGPMPIEDKEITVPNISCTISDGDLARLQQLLTHCVQVSLIMERTFILKHFYCYWTNINNY